jgi:hypothetical protein
MLCEKRSSFMAISSLPVLALPHPIIFSLSARVALTVSKPIGLLALLDTSDSLPIVVAVPVTSPPLAPTPNLAEWGIAGRVLRLTKPPTENTRVSCALRCFSARLDPGTFPVAFTTTGFFAK